MITQFICTICTRQDKPILHYIAITALKQRTNREHYKSVDRRKALSVEHVQYWHCRWTVTRQITGYNTQPAAAWGVCHIVVCDARRHSGTQEQQAEQRLSYTDTIYGTIESNKIVTGPQCQSLNAKRACVDCHSNQSEWAVLNAALYTYRTFYFTNRFSYVNMSNRLMDDSHKIVIKIAMSPFHGKFVLIWPRLKLSGS